ncbi:MAG: hypothetical protein AAF184_25850, partial [Pseudomonadota bacterium]
MRTFFVLLMLVGTQAYASTPATQDSAGVAHEVQEAFRRFETNLNRGDYAAALAFYADDPRFVAY